MLRSLVGSEMCIRDRPCDVPALPASNVPFRLHHSSPGHFWTTSAPLSLWPPAKSNSTIAICLFPQDMTIQFHLLLFTSPLMRPISGEVKRRRWNWIGHVLRKDADCDCAVALGWRPEGKRSRGRPKMTWRRMVEAERDIAGWQSWNAARRVAASRPQWRESVRALCA